MLCVAFLTRKPFGKSREFHNMVYFVVGNSCHLQPCAQYFWFTVYMNMEHGTWEELNLYL